MSDILVELQSLFWLIIPLAVIQLILVIIGIRDWRKSQDALGDNKLIWLLIIVFVNILGPLIYLYYSRTSLLVSSPNDDDWEVSS
ncbi:MAG: PLDc N-terminal domain-containing protein [Candidatus Hodarchaeales archaeon]|jgi:hypothetical protein